MLVCERCGCGCHTYCSGLGMEVPEGDWFCPHCAACLAE